MSQSFLKPSKHPISILDSVAHKGQLPSRRMYREGYEQFMALLPRLDPADDMFFYNMDVSKLAMRQLHHELLISQWVFKEDVPKEGDMNRTILAIDEDSHSELVLTKWGNGFKASAHGHAAGFMYEQVLSGMFKHTTYRVVDTEKMIVRPVETKVFAAGDVMSQEYFMPHESLSHGAIVHSVESVGFSTCVHYINQHPTDGTQNVFTPMYFDDVWEYENQDLIRISSKEAMYLRKGSVILVRSQNIPEYGDHYMIVTGAPIMKNHGLRPQEFSIEAPTNKVLSKYEPVHGLILLELQEEAREAFHQFHGISMKDGEVVFTR